MALLSIFGAACEDVSSWAPDPYESLRDESVSLGAIDPVLFPQANLGVGGDRTKPGGGAFHEIPAYAGGERIGYFSYTMNTPANRDRLRLLDNGANYAGVVPAYAFDATDAAPVPDRNGCQAPANYNPDDPETRRVNAVRLDQQGNIFTAVPRATYTPGVAASTTYLPVVAAAPLSSPALPCQLLKSEKALDDRKLKPAPDGRYLAWLVIDPASAVYPKEDVDGAGPGLGLQRWGWWKRYLIAYLDGGFIPTAEVDIMEGPMAAPVMKKVTRMVPQRLYVPRSPVVVDMEEGPAALGAGYDVLGAKRGAMGYSPLCEVVTYAMPMNAPTPAEMLPKDAAMIEANFGPIMPATGSLPRYVFCLQVR